MKYIVGKLEEAYNELNQKIEEISNCLEEVTL